MLVLRRKVGEAIVLNGVITVYVLAVEGERVKVGIDAPPDVVIVRQELLAADGQERALRGKQKALARETDPTKRERIALGITRIQQVATLAPASLEARQE